MCLYRPWRKSLPRASSDVDLEFRTIAGQLTHFLRYLQSNAKDKSTASAGPTISSVFAGLRDTLGSNKDQCDTFAEVRVPEASAHDSETQTSAEKELDRLLAPQADLDAEWDGFAAEYEAAIEDWRLRLWPGSHVVGRPEVTPE